MGDIVLAGKLIKLFGERGDSPLLATSNRELTASLAWEG